MAETILILGGGFGGIAAANTLRRTAPAGTAVTLLDRSPRFHVGAGKTWVMLGERTVEEISAARPTLLEPGVNFVQADVQRIDLAQRAVECSAGRLAWDYLVIALGAEVNPAAVSGLAEAHTFYTVEGAEKLRPVVANFSGGEIALLIAKAPFKCPPAPYEAAMLLHRYFADHGRGAAVRLSLYTAEGTPMATAGPEMGAFIRAELAARGISFHPQKAVTRVAPGARQIDFADGTSATCDLLITVPPHEAPAVLREAQLLNPAGWVPVDPRTLEVKHPAAGGRIFAVGDVTAVPLPGRFKPDVPLSLPKAGVMAEAQGVVAAEQIAARLRGETSEAAFVGRGFCFLEMGGGRAVKAEGDFFALPHPVMNKQTPSAEQMADKLAWVRRHLLPIAKS